MIPFKLPQLSMSLSDYMDIVAQQKEAGSCIGLCIGLGKLFFDDGVSQVDQHLLMLLDKAGKSVNPRVIPSYAMLLWFTLKITIGLHCILISASCTDLLYWWHLSIFLVEEVKDHVY